MKSFPTEAPGCGAALQRPLFDTLESRTLLSMSVGSDGWTDITASSDTRKIYVSSSTGRDTNAGTSSSAPVKTLAKAKSLVRDGRPDWMLLKRGDTWYESLGSWDKSGRAQQEPMVVATYGTGARPMLKTGSSYGVNFCGRNVNNLVIKGLYFHSHTRDPGEYTFHTTEGRAGMRIVGSGANILIEDNVVDSYTENIVVDDWEGRFTNIRIRRNVVVDAYDSSDGKAQGLYVTGVDGVMIEGNVFDHNGWSEKAPGGEATVYSHNIYMQSGNTGVTVKSNIIANAASHGLQARSGGTITNNLFLRNPIHLSFGFVNGATVKAWGVSGVIDGNVFYSSRDINGAKRGWAIEVSNVKAGGGTAIRNNLFAQDSQKAYAAIVLGYGSGVDNQEKAVGINDLTIHDNRIYNWHSAVTIKSGLKPGGTGYNALNRLVVRDNDFQNTHSSKIVSHGTTFSTSAESWSANRYYDDAASSGWFSLSGSTTSYDSWKSKVETSAGRTKVGYVDPTRSIASYNASVGGAADYYAYMSEARKQGESSWRSSYTAGSILTYLNAGYKEGAASSGTGSTGGTTGGTGSTGGTTGGTTTPSDTTGPTVLTKSYSSTAITIRFSEDVSASLVPSDLVIVNTSTGMVVSGSMLALTYDKSTNTATWRFPVFGSGKLPVGQYSVRLPSASVTDAAGNKLRGGANGATGDLLFNFSVL